MKYCQNRKTIYPKMHACDPKILEFNFLYALHWRLRYCVRTHIQFFAAHATHTDRYWFLQHDSFLIPGYAQIVVPIADCTQFSSAYKSELAVNGKNYVASLQQPISSSICTHDARIWQTVVCCCAVHILYVIHSHLNLVEQVLRWCFFSIQCSPS